VDADDITISMEEDRQSPIDPAILLLWWGFLGWCDEAEEDDEADSVGEMVEMQGTKVSW
jgi:hypothetical protein